MTFLGLDWYWWLIFAMVLVVSIPFKVRFIKWWSKYYKGSKKNRPGKWGEEE